jgi:uncharacterized protein YbjT (DUF2867 family)
VLILGAGGQVARHVIERLSTSDSVYLTLYLRNASRLKDLETQRVKLIEADILNTEKLQAAMQRQDIVYVNINGQENIISRHTVSAMQSAGVNRLIFIAAVGIYDEVPGSFGKWNKQMIGEILERYKKVASIIEHSNLNYTILRPTWYTNK